MFGQTPQNPRNHRTADVVGTLKKAKKLVAHPLHKFYQKLNENLYALERSIALCWIRQSRVVDATNV